MRPAGRLEFCNISARTRFFGNPAGSYAAWKSEDLSARQASYFYSISVALLTTCNNCPRTSLSHRQLKETNAKFSMFFRPFRTNQSNRIYDSCSPSSISNYLPVPNNGCLAKQNLLNKITGKVSSPLFAWFDTLIWFRHESPWKIKDGLGWLTLHKR